MRDLPRGIRINHGYVEVRIFPKGSRPYYKTFGKDSPIARQLAAIHLNEKRKEILMGTFNIVRVGRIKVSDAFDVFIKRHFENYRDPQTNEPRSKDSIINSRTLVKAPIDFFGKEYLDTLTVKSLREYRQQRTEFDDMANGTVNRELVMLSSMINCFRLWIELGEIKPVRLPTDKMGAAINPCELLPKLIERPRDRIASRGELISLYRACAANNDMSMWSIIETELDTTLRYSDLMKLETVEIVDDQITIRQGKTGNIVKLPANAKPQWHRVFTNFRHRWEIVRSTAGCEDLQFRDLRKTGLRMLEELGYSADDITLTTGHADKGVLEKWYLSGSAKARKALPLIEARRAVIAGLKTL